MKPIDFFIPGLPQPGGSKRAFYVPKLGRAIVTDDNPKAKDWKRTVAAFAQEHYTGPILDGPLRVEASFIMPRIKGHFGTKGLKASAPLYHTVKPDVSKLFRSTEDALTGIVWRDDGQICEQALSKRYGDKPGVHLLITQLDQNAEQLLPKILPPLLAAEGVGDGKG